MRACEKRQPAKSVVEGINTGMKYNSKPSWQNPEWIMDSTTVTRQLRMPSDNGRLRPGEDVATEQEKARQDKAVPTLHYTTIDGKQTFRHAMPWQTGPSPEVEKAGLESEWCVVCNTACPRLKDHESSSGQWKITAAKCSLCARTVCKACKMPDHQADQSRFQAYCRRCWTEVAYCDWCHLML